MSPRQHIQSYLVLSLVFSLIIVPAAGAAEGDIGYLKKLTPEQSLNTVLAVANSSEEGQALSTEQIDQEIKRQEGIKTLSVAGMVIGIAVIIGGAVVAYNQAQEEAEKEAEEEGEGFAVVPNLIGLGIGLPIAGISLYSYYNADNKIQELEAQKANLSMGQLMFRLSFKLNF